MSKFTLIMDSSQLSAAWECVQKWDYLYNKAIVPISRKTIETEDGEAVEVKQAFLMGTYGHKLLEAYDYGLIIGLTSDQSVEFMCSSEYHNPKYGLVTKEYLEEHKQLKLDTKILVRNRVLEYLLTRKFNYYKPEAVELGFSEILHEDSSNLFVLEGRIDVLAVDNQGVKICVDHKFQSRKHNLYKRRIQFKNYTLITDRPFEVNYIQLSKKPNENSFHRDRMDMDKNDKSVWRKQVISKYFEIKRFMEEGYISPKDWQNPAACEGAYSLCTYTDLCEQSNQKLVQLKISRDFETTKVWRPW